jgi:MFS transporter, MHS family, alpha-ketoglutarate permease
MAVTSQQSKPASERRVVGNVIRGSIGNLIERSI